MRPVANPSSPDYRSPQWVQALGEVIERMGLWPAIALCTLLAATGAILVTLPIAMFLTPHALVRPMLTAAFVTSIVTPPISFAVFRLLQDLTLTRKALRQIANHDALTQAHSRRFFMSAANEPVRTARQSAPESILLLDIDDFKKINDHHGHLFGDKVLQAVSDTCRSQLRADDLFARFGGEEFVILLADTEPDVARAVAGRILRAIADLQVLDPDGLRIPVTASLGIAHRGDRVRGAGTALLEQALGLADKALYTAKRNGKNRFEFVSVGESTQSEA